jgi:hypothetical protein
MRIIFSIVGGLIALAAVAAVVALSYDIGLSDHPLAGLDLSGPFQQSAD